MTPSLRTTLFALLALCLAVAAVQGRPQDADDDVNPETDVNFDDDPETDTTDDKTTPSIINAAETSDDTTAAQISPKVPLLIDSDDSVEQNTDAQPENTPAEETKSPSEDNKDSTAPQPSPSVILRNYPGDPIENVDPETTPIDSSEDDDVIWSRADGRRRNAEGDIVIEDTDDAVEDRLEGVMPSLPPDEDPVTVFAPWTIAVIAGVGAIIVAVVAYYIWQRWTEIRSCCCGGEYSQP